MDPQLMFLDNTFKQEVMRQLGFAFIKIVRVAGRRSLAFFHDFVDCCQSGFQVGNFNQIAKCILSS